MDVISIHRYIVHTDKSSYDKPAKDPGRETNKQKDITIDLKL